MNFNHIRTLLKKADIILSGEEELSSLEKDILKEYLRKAYEMIDESSSKKSTFQNHSNAGNKTTNNGSVNYPPPPVEKKIIESDKPDSVSPQTNLSVPFEKEKRGTIEDKIKEELPKNETSTQIEKDSNTFERETSYKPYSIPEKIKEERKPDPIPQRSETVKQTVVLKDKPLPKKHQALFLTNAKKELSDILSSSPIEDLKKSFSINDRLQYIRLLFDGHLELFNKVISHLNEMQDFEEARNFLSDQIIDRYDWTAEHKFETAWEFIELVRRKVNS